MNPVESSEIVPRDWLLALTVGAVPTTEVRLHGRRSVDEDDIPAILGQVALGERGGDGRGDRPLPAAAATATATTAAAATSELRMRAQHDERLRLTSVLVVW